MVPEEAHVTVPVALAGRSYNIVIGDGLLADAGTRIVARFPGARAAIVSDKTVSDLHLATLTAALAAAGVEMAAPITVPPGEASKSFSELERVIAHLLDARIERQDVVIAFGGGVVGDLAGFAASVLRRGVRVTQIPTSLLAQVDSSVGGKTGIDTRHGKNLVGTFHQPSLVLADTAVLDTLSPRQFRAGYAEVAKYGLIRDAAFFAWLEDAWPKIFDRSDGGVARRQAIAESCRAKAEVVAADEREAGERALLNLGHTFGHAFEAATGYSERLIHGEAIAIGMVLALRYSERLNMAPSGLAQRVCSHFKAVGLPTEIAHIPGEIPHADGLLDLMAQDKKVERGALTLILARDIGHAEVVKGIDPAPLRAFLADEMAGATA
ncbi:MAG: 3-dehydroquinate synthase [Pseudomonadota bacterium]